MRLHLKNERNQRKKKMRGGEESLICDPKYDSLL